MMLFDSPPTMKAASMELMLLDTVASPELVVIFSWVGVRTVLCASLET